MCSDFEINRYKTDELENMQTSYILNDITSRKNRYVVRHGCWDTSDRCIDQEHCETNKKSLRLPVQQLWLKQWFSCFGDLDDLCSIFCHTH